jgi:NitT/TauT family transport system substrate-binding protein
MVIVSGETTATAYYAKELGLFAKAGIEPEITDVTNGAVAAAAVAGGSMDIGAGEPTSLIIAHDRGLPFSILAPAALARAGNQSNGFVIAGKTNGVKSGADLTGKIVGLNALGGLPYLSVRAWIDKTGGDSGAVHFLELPFSQMIEAIKSGRIEASEINAAFDPLIGKPDDPVRLIASSYDYVAPRFTSSVWFATTDWIAKNPDLAKRFMSAMRQAAVWANAHPSESAEMLAPHLKQTVAQIEATTRVSYGLDMLPEFIQPVIDLAAKYGSIKTRFAARDLINAVALK